MSPNELMSASDQRLVASSVYDQRNVYIGIVVRVNHDVDDQLSLLVQGSEPGAETNQLQIVGAAIQHLDLDQKKVYVNLEQYPPSWVQIEALPLWQERVVVNRNRRKIGEISIRKTTDVYTVEVPVRSEKLIVENIETGEIITEVDLSNTEVTQNDFSGFSSTLTYTEDQVVRGHLTQFRDVINFLEAVNQFPNNSFVKSKVTLTLVQPKRTETITQTFESAQTALQVLLGMANLVATTCKNIYLEVWVSDRERGATYQSWLSRYRQSAMSSNAASPKLPPLH